MSGYPNPTRPLGVAILAVLLGLFGFFAFLGGIALLLVAAIVSFSPVYLFGAPPFFAGLILIVFGIVAMVVAAGLWRLRQWALVIALVILGLALLSNFAGGRFFTFTTVVEALLLVYLLLVRSHFR